MSARCLTFVAAILAETIAIPALAQDPVGPQEPADHSPEPPESVEPGFLPPEPAPTDAPTDPLPGDPDSVPVTPAPDNPVPGPTSDALPPPGTSAEVVARDGQGRATRVRAAGVDYPVCADGQSDRCINPREAGLDFGDVPLDTWPGRPVGEAAQD